MYNVYICGYGSLSFVSKSKTHDEEFLLRLAFLRAFVLRMQDLYFPLLLFVLLLVFLCSFQGAVSASISHG